MDRKSKVWMAIYVLPSLILASNPIAMADNKISSNIIHNKTMSNPSQITYAAIKATGENFVEFLRKTGQLERAVTQDDLQIFAPQCKKVVNGKVLFTSPHAYPEQIANARKGIGKWTVSTLWTTISKEDRTYTLLFKWTAEKMAESITMATLFLDDAGKIIEIQEVYNLYDQKKLSIQDT